MIGIVRRRRDVLGLRDLRVLAFADPLDALLLPRLPIVDVVLDLGHVDLHEERLMRGERRPIGPVPIDSDRRRS